MTNPNSGSSPQTFVMPPPIVEPTARWVRVRFGGKIIADSTHALLLIAYGPRQLPAYCFPKDDVQMDALEKMPEAEEQDGKVYYRVKVGEHTADRAAWVYENPPQELAALRGYVSFKWGAMDAWYEEDEEIFVHARDPHKRVDVLRSTRHVQVMVEGVTVADTHRPALLFETNLPTRYYIPAEDVHMDLLEPSDTSTSCPYKGKASYWSVKLGDKVVKDIVWGYHNPIPECPKIKDLLAFYNEKVEIYVDGELEPLPLTPWS